MFYKGTYFISSARLSADTQPSPSPRAERNMLSAYAASAENWHTLLEGFVWDDPVLFMPVAPPIRRYLGLHVKTTRRTSQADIPEANKTAASTPYDFDDKNLSIFRDCARKECCGREVRQLTESATAFGAYLPWPQSGSPPADGHSQGRRGDRRGPTDRVDHLQLRGWHPRAFVD
jgi:hypothetical protein